MQKVNDDCYIVNNDLDLLYSPDECIWYFQKFLHDGNYSTEISQSFKSKDAALLALSQNKLTWR